MAHWSQFSVSIQFDNEYHLIPERVTRKEWKTLFTQMSPVILIHIVLKNSEMLTGVFFFFCAWIKGIANKFGGKYPFLKSKQNPACFFSVPSKATPPKYIHMLSRLSPWMLVQELTCNMTDRQVEMPPYPDWLDVRDPCHFSWEVLATRIFPLCIYLLQQILQQWANQKIGFNDQTKQNSFGVYV